MFPLLPFPSPGEVFLFSLVLARVGGIFAALPVFGGRRLPVRIKATAVIMITLVCFPILDLKSPPMPADAFTLALLVSRELMIGITLAFITQIIFAAVEFSGQIIGLQMGFSISSVIDPAMGNQTQIMSVMQTLLATLMFLSLNIHHLFIRTIVDSFSILPIGSWRMSGGLVTFLVNATSDIFIIGIRLAAPVMVALLFVTVALGIMARAFPQMNVFMISLPLNIGVGFIVLGITLMLFFHVLEISFGNVKIQIDTLYRLMAKGG